MGFSYVTQMNHMLLMPRNLWPVSQPPESRVHSWLILSHSVRFYDYSTFIRINNVVLVVKYVPSWFPGAGFKKKAKAWKDLLPDFVDKPYDDVAASMVCTVSSSLSAVSPKRFIGIGKRDCNTMCSYKLIERIKEKPETENDELVARDVTAIAYAGEH